MRAPLAISLCFSFITGWCQISTVDLVRVKASYEKEAIFFYENNWKVFREEALRQKFISGFELIKSETDTTGVLTVFLITDYPDSLSFANREKNFEGITTRLSPGGAKMLNSVTRKEFLIGLTGYRGRAITRK